MEPLWDWEWKVLITILTALLFLLVTRWLFGKFNGQEIKQKFLKLGLLYLVIVVIFLFYLPSAKLNGLQTPWLAFLYPLFWPKLFSRTGFIARLWIYGFLIFLATLIVREALLKIKHRFSEKKILPSLKSLLIKSLPIWLMMTSVTLLMYGALFSLPYLKLQQGITIYKESNIPLSAKIWQKNPWLSDPYQSWTLHSFEWYYDYEKFWREEGEVDIFTYQWSDGVVQFYTADFDSEPIFPPMVYQTGVAVGALWQDCSRHGLEPLNFSDRQIYLHARVRYDDVTLPANKFTLNWYNCLFDVWIEVNSTYRGETKARKIVLDIAWASYLGAGATWIDVNEVGHFFFIWDQLSMQGQWVEYIIDLNYVMEKAQGAFGQKGFKFEIKDVNLLSINILAELQNAGVRIWADYLYLAYNKDIEIKVV